MPNPITTRAGEALHPGLFVPFLPSPASQPSHPSQPASILKISHFFDPSQQGRVTIRKIAFSPRHYCIVTHVTFQKRGEGRTTVQKGQTVRLGSSVPLCRNPPVGSPWRFFLLWFRIFEVFEDPADPPHQGTLDRLGPGVERSFPGAVRLSRIAVSASAGSASYDPPPCRGDVRSRGQPSGKRR